jgi:hypothetical protein
VSSKARISAVSLSLTTVEFYTIMALCHCIDCQRWSGAPFTSNVVVPRDQFHLLTGEPKVFDVIGDSGNPNSHFFCGKCGSSLYTAPAILPNIVCIKAGTLDNGLTDLGRDSVDVEWYTKDRVNYIDAFAGLRQELTLSAEDVAKLQNVLCGSEEKR